MGNVKKHHAEGAVSARRAHSRRSDGGSHGRLDACSQKETGATGPTRSEGSGAEVDQRGGLCEASRPRDRGGPATADRIRAFERRRDVCG